MIRNFLIQLTRLAGCGLMTLATLPAAAADDGQEFNRLQDQCSQQCAAGQYAHAQQTGLAMRRLAEGPLKANPAFLAHALRAQAMACQAQARYSEAEPLLQQALTLCEKSLGPQQLEARMTLNALANLYTDQGRCSAAEPPAKRALTISEKAASVQPLVVAADLKLLASIYLQEARYAEAEPLLKRAIALCEAARGRDDVSVAGNIGTLGTLYQEQGRYAEAEPLLKRAVAINERAVGPQHPWVADWLNNLARLYSVQGRYAEAESICKRALAIREKTRGGKHPGVATSLKVLANLYSSQGRYAEAEPLLKRAVAICEKRLPANHPLLAGNLGSLATLYMNQGRYAEAEPLLKRAIAIDEKAIGPEHPWVADWLNSLALSYYHQERFAEAEPLFQRALEIVKKTKGPRHTEYARGLHNLAMLYDHQGNFPKAEFMSRKALAIWENTPGPESPQMGIGLGRLSQILYRQGRYDEAEPLVDQSIAILDRAGSAPGRRFESYLLRARIAWNRQLRNEALADLHQAMQLAEQQRAESSGSAHERAETFTKYNDAFEQMVAWQIELKDMSEALAAMERSRARSLLEDMTQSGVDLQAGRSALERKAQGKEELQLKQQVNVLEKQLDALQTDPQTPAAQKPARRQELEAALATARKAFYEHYRDVRATSPVYRQLLTVGAGPPRLSQIERRLVGKGGLLLTYLLGSKGGYVLAIGPEEAELAALSIDDSAAKILEIKAGPLTANCLAGALENERGTGVVQQLRDPKEASGATEKLAALWKVLIPAAQRKATHRRQTRTADRHTRRQVGPLALRDPGSRFPRPGKISAGGRSGNPLRSFGHSALQPGRPRGERRNRRTGSGAHGRKPGLLRRGRAGGSQRRRRLEAARDPLALSGPGRQTFRPALLGLGIGLGCRCLPEGRNQDLAAPRGRGHEGQGPRRDGRPKDHPPRLPRPGRPVVRQYLRRPGPRARRAAGRRGR